VAVAIARWITKSKNTVVTMDLLPI